jgi:hypothetical protein
MPLDIIDKKSDNMLGGESPPKTERQRGPGPLSGGKDISRNGATFRVGSASKQQRKALERRAAVGEESSAKFPRLWYSDNRGASSAMSWRPPSSSKAPTITRIGERGLKPGSD